MKDTRTKIVCTIGPASRDERILRKLIRAGMDVARINFSHGTQAEHAKDIAAIRSIAQEENLPIAIMADLQGPKLRIGIINPEPLVLKEGDLIILTSYPATGKDNRINLPHPELISDARVGDQLYLDDGTFELLVVKQHADELVCKVITGGNLCSQKGIVIPRNRPRDRSPISAITPKDREDTLFALKHGVDFIALSFVRSVQDVEALHMLIDYENAKQENIAIVAKIEKREALDDFDAILAAVDGVMVARGDLGVEISVENVPFYQKEIIRKCNAVGKPVITATQMLQSMMSNPKPTRAETSDVANAILDGTDAVMLSGETAVGSYPVDAVVMLAKISAIVEDKMLSWVDAVSFADIERTQPITDAISDAAATIARNLGARLIVTSTWSGYTARQVARERPREPILALTSNETTYRRLALTWGVTPVLLAPYQDIDKMFTTIDNILFQMNLAVPGDLVVVTGGVPLGGSGRTNFLKVHQL
ncbi:pyruvate kinase [Candidatus Acetothermia bacterium]|jgi:pyruvate kinase|nr:pyruvate kinase [Candidatus Acetothermia bacterium]MCI2426386.1 pyruvate kinase [Candidatus Acetothermia bacterium]MCI2427853.1 pyruvate kinase [Candidatus Acetothermia bacterium]MCI2428842.1 pyruvate kinase [Candidatus Acetothermia bacterium]